MASKTEMIEYIVKNSDNEMEDLEALNYNAIKRIFNTIETIEEEPEDEIIVTSEMVDEMIFGEKEEKEPKKEPKKETKTFTIEIPDMSEEEAKEYVKSIQEKFKENVKIEEVEEVDYFTLSPVQRRAYQRSGRIPKKK